MTRRFLLASNETWAMGPDVTRATTNPPVRHTSNFNPTLAVVVSSMIVCFFVVGFATGYFKRYIVLSGETPETAGNEQTRSRRRTNRSTKPRDVGLDPEVVSALPLVKFAEFVQKGKYAEDCAVCLAVFEDSDRLRVLPQCAHAFHAECVDEWFKSHSTCPLCRDSLKKLDAEDARTEDHDVEGVAEQGGMRRPTDFDVVEVVIRGESSGAAVALSGFSQEVATTEEAAQVNPSAFIRTIRIGTSPGVKSSIRRSSSVDTGLRLRPYVVDSEGTQHNFRVHAIAADHEQSRELSTGGAPESLAIGVLLNFKVGARGLQHAWSTRWSFPNLRQMETP